MMYKAFFLKILSIVLFGILFTGCESQYDKGYKKGYSIGYSEGEDYGYNIGYESGESDGYNSGKKDGYKEGKDDGYTSGYANGTVAYVKEHGLPSLGLAIVILLFFATIYYLYRYFENPTKRAIDETIDVIEEVRQKNSTQKELIRKKLSVEEQARIRAHNIANNVFKVTVQAIRDERSRAEIENLKQQAEEKILKIQTEGIMQIAAEFQKSIEDLNAAEHLSAKEKSELFSEIRDTISKF